MRILAVSQLIGSHPGEGTLGRLTPREHEVVGLMAERWSNAAIASGLVVSESAIGKHIAKIFFELDLPPSEGDNRRVRAVLAYLNQ